MDNNGYTHDNGEALKNGHKNGFSTNGKLPTDVSKPALPEEEEDPWKVSSINPNYTPWSELDSKHKFYRVASYLIKLILVMGCMYMFICSLDFLSSAFKLLGGEAAGRVFQQNDIMTNPLAGLMMGVMVTVLVQSSSTSSSIIVSMVGAGILDIKTAIPIIMGANIGTSVTNTIVSLGQISDEGEFRRAFAGATVHDMFNWLSVLVILPIEVATGFLFHLTKTIVDTLPIETNKGAKQDILKVITKPFTEKIIQINKDAITKISKNEEAELETDHIIMKMCCDKTPPLKCCKNLLKTNDFSSDVLNMSARQNFCQDVNQCITGLDTVPANCPTAPWTYTSLHYENRVTLNCSAFSWIESEIDCCQSAFDAKDFYAKDGTVTVSKADRESFCKSPTPLKCFRYRTHTFTETSCIDDSNWIDTKQLIEGKDSFQCLDWMQETVNTTCNKECDYLFKGLYPDLNDKEVGGILLVIALFILCCCLVFIVKLLHSLLKGPMAVMIKKFVNADFPGPLGYLTGYLAILIGAGLTIVVQSSSIFTSSLTPLVGIGVIELDRMYPLTLGSNIGTTTTSILSALANSGEKLQDSLQVAFAHLFFNILGILIFYPLPFFRPAIPLAKFLGNRTAKYRWFAIVYLIMMFFVFPVVVFALSLAGWYVMAAILIPIVLVLIFVAIIKLIQDKRPEALPRKLQDWKFLPVWMRSLAPYDKLMRKIFFCTRFQRVGEEEDHMAMQPYQNDKITFNTRV